MLILHILVFCILAGSLFVHFFTRPTRVRSEALGHAEGTSTRFMVASGGVLSQRCGDGGPGVCLGDGQTEAEGVPSQGGRGDGVCPHTRPDLERAAGDRVAMAMRSFVQLVLIARDTAITRPPLLWPDNEEKAVNNELIPHARDELEAPMFE